MKVYMFVIVDYVFQYVTNQMLFLENSTTQFVVCQKNYTDSSRCRYFKYMAEDYHLCDCRTQALLRVAKSGIHIGKPYYTCEKSYSDPNRCRYFMLYQIEYYIL
jgi:hypothetical protein